MTRRNRRGVLAVLPFLAAGGLACTSANPQPPPLSTSGPEIRCRTVLEVRPGALGTASNATPVQKCEPVMPAPSSPAAGEQPQPPAD